jgi:hypothetical protein
MPDILHFKKSVKIFVAIFCSITNLPHTYHNKSTTMKTIACVTAVIALVTLTSITASAQSQSPQGQSAQGQMAIGAGLDIMMPVGTFGNHWGTGFGATGEFEYPINPRANVTGKIGYLRWSAKDLPSGVSATYSAVPLLVGGKYYPLFAKDLPVRVYGHLELGLMVGSLSMSGFYNALGSSKTDFTISPSVGMEIPAGQSGSIDLSLRYFDISEKSSVAIRAGYVLPIGK